MIIEMVADVLRKRNQFPANDGVSDKISPLTIVNGDGPPDFNKMKFEFGAYGQAFQSNSPTNTNTTRSVGAIALSMTPNKNGEYKFVSLNTGKLIHRRQCKALPITDEVIRRVHELTKRDNQSTIDKGEISVEWRPGLPINSIREENGVGAVYDQIGREGNEIDVNTDDDHDDNSSQGSIDSNSDERLLPTNETHETDSDEEDNVSKEEDNNPSQYDNEEYAEDDASQQSIHTMPEDGDNDGDGTEVETDVETPTHDDTDVEESDQATSGSTQAQNNDRTNNSYNLRRRDKLPDYGFRLSTQMNKSDHKTSYEVTRRRRPATVKEE